MQLPTISLATSNAMPRQASPFRPRYCPICTSSPLQLLWCEPCPCCWRICIRAETMWKWSCVARSTSLPLPLEIFCHVAGALGGDDRSNLFSHRMWVLQWLLCHGINFPWNPFQALYGAVVPISVHPADYQSRENVFDYLCRFVIPY